MIITVSLIFSRFTRLKISFKVIWKGQKKKVILVGKIKIIFVFKNFKISTKTYGFTLIFCAPQERIFI